MSKPIKSPTDAEITKWAKAFMKKHHKKLAEIKEERDAYEYINKYSLRRFGMKILKRGFGEDFESNVPFVTLTFGDAHGATAVARLDLEPVGEC